MVVLTDKTITFGKYRNQTLDEVLKDRNYCKWLIKQDWFQTNYGHIYRQVVDYKPNEKFFSDDKDSSLDQVYHNTTQFMKHFPYFYMVHPLKIRKELTENEYVCYKFYVDTMIVLRKRIQSRINKGEENVYNIKAISGWLKNFEKDSGLSREQFKQFIYEHDLPNITTVIEHIKKQGGIDYKGAKSYNIARKNSQIQEQYWENILKQKYGEEGVGVQFKYENCIFDFIHIPNNTIYECKLGMKDFNKTQYRKYCIILEKYNIIYLIGKDIVIDMNKKKVYLRGEQSRIAEYLLCDLVFADPSFRELIEKFEICVIQESLSSVI